MMSRAKAIGIAARLVGREISSCEDNLYRARLQMRNNAPDSVFSLRAAEYAAPIEEKLTEYREVLHILGEMQNET